MGVKGVKAVRGTVFWNHEWTRIDTNGTRPQGLFSYATGQNWFQKMRADAGGVGVLARETGMIFKAALKLIL